MQIQKRHPWTKRIVIAVALCTAILFSFGTTAAQADLGAAAKSVPSASLVGEGRMKFLGFNVFDAQLYAPNGVYSSSNPFALRLTYLRNFKGKAIAEKSAEEMAKQGVSKAQLGGWTKQMTAIFPNVSSGQSITGVRTASGSSVFYLGNKEIGTIADPAFTKHFFDIWLGSNTQNPRLRAKLVGAGS
ncbi:chalcone isomerase family protein [Roseibium sp.]|uniref:chalcone isomerase family protein n=1 Tax=Roseibium sp. TaxID=1936156 RepID=UPI003918CFE0